MLDCFWLAIEEQINRFIRFVSGYLPKHACDAGIAVGQRKRCQQR